MLKQKKIIFFILSLLSPLLIVSILLALKGIWWGSETSILASDSFHQYVIFNQTLRNALHGDGSLFYTFTSGLGLNFYALSSYYLGSFLSPLVFFFNLESMPDAIYLLTIVKFGLIGLSSYFSLSSIYKNLNNWLVLSLSTSFALMSFATSQLEINIWLDVLILIPLILLGLHKLINGRGMILYFFSLTALFIQNYYFGYMTAIFITLWFLVQLSWDFKQRIKRILDFIVMSTLAGLASMIMLLPTYFDLRTHGETFTKIVNLKTESSWYFDLFAKNLVGSYDTTKFGAIPMIYVGLFPLLFVILFFTIKSIKWQVKVAYAALLAFLVASFYLQPLDLLWQGMHAPNMFLHRYAWVFSVIVIYMAAEALSRFKEIQFRTLVLPFGVLGLGFLLTFFFKNEYAFLQDIHFLLTLEFLIAYCILLVSTTKKRISFTVFALASTCFILFELSLHTYYQIEGLSAEWNFPSRANYEKQLTDIEELVNYTKQENTTFFRTEKLSPQTGNDSMKYDYNGISQFSSIRNRASSSVLDKLGFRSDGTNLNLRYQNNTLIADSLFGIKYNLAESDPAKYGFSYEKNASSINLYQNTFATQLAILTDSLYKDVKLTNLTLDNQTNFLNQLTGLNLQYYSTLTPTTSENATEFDNRVTVKAINDEEMARVNYTLHIPANSQLYVSIPNITFTNENSKSVQITVNNVSSTFTLDNTFSFFNVGYFSQEKDVTVSIQFPQNDQVSFDAPSFYRLYTQAYQEAMDKINEKEVSVVTNKNQITATYTSEKDASLLFTLPYDQGWTATQDGKKVTISRAQNGLMKIDVKKGSGTIVLTFVPKGFWVGLACSIISLFLFTIYSTFRNKKQKSTD